MHFALRFCLIAVALLLTVGCNRDDGVTPTMRNAPKMGRATASEGISSVPQGPLTRYADGGTFGGTGPAWSPDGKTIVFAALTNESSDLFMIGSDGQNLIRLTSTPFWERDAVFGPSGRIIFVSDEHNPAGEYHAINKDGGELQRLAPGLGLTCELGLPTSCYRPSFSATGESFVFSADASGKRSLYLWQTYGSPPKQLTHTDAKDFFPLFKADGGTVLCMRLSQGPGSIVPSLVQVSVSDGSSKTLLDDGVWRVPVALRGDDRFVDLLVMSKQTTFSIWTYGLDDASLRRLTQPDAHIGDVISCEDQLLMVGDFDKPFAYELYSITDNGSASLERLTTDERYAGEPRCSPDGEWVVYVDGDKRGLGSIMIMPSRGGAGRVLCANHFDID